MYNGTKKETLETFLSAKYPNKDILFVGGCWSSTAFIVDDIVVRFPKKDINDYNTEAKILPFIRNKILFPVPNVKIDDNAEFPYAYHQILIGNKWTLDEISSLNETKINKLSKDCALFFHQLHQVPIAEIKRIVPNVKSHYKCELIPENSLWHILKQYMPKHRFDILYSKYQKAVSYISDDLIFSHGDFSGSNSLVDESYNLVGIFDWASCGVEEREYEFFRFWNDDNKFLNKVVEYYEELSKIQINKERIKDIFLLDNINILHAIHTREHLFSTRESRMGWLMKNLKIFC